MPPPNFAYDPFAKEVLKNPIPFYKELRANHPVYYVEKYDLFVFSRFQDIVDLLSIQGENVLVGSEFTVPRPDLISHRNDGAPPLPSINPMSPGPTLPTPQYEEMRQAYMKPLRPKSVAALESFVRELTRERLKLLLPCKKFDLTAEYGAYLTAAVTCHLFGLPLSEAPAVMAAVNALASFSPHIEAVDIPGAFDDLKRFLVPSIQKRRAAGADGSLPIIDGMISYRTRGDNRALTDDEISDQLTCPFVGNVETAAKPIAIGLRLLALHPNQLAEVRADLDKNVPIVVEEILRLGTTAQWAVRTAHKDFTIAGQHIKPGQRVMFLMFSAARDEREYENPEEFIWNRSIRRSLVFGLGQHHCVGSHIARLQIRVLVHEFLAHVKSYDFDMSEAEHSITYFHWGWMKLPVVIQDYAI